MVKRKLLHLITFTLVFWNDRYSYVSYGRVNRSHVDSGRNTIRHTDHLSGEVPTYFIPTKNDCFSNFGPSFSPLGFFDMFV